MRIEHVAIWTADLDRLVAFYSRYFDARPGPLYENATKGFRSRFLDLADGARLELMTTTRIDPVKHAPGAERMGLTHIALSLGGRTQVDALTERLRRDGLAVVDGPRETGDGYYESVVLDPDGNRLELTV